MTATPDRHPPVLSRRGLLRLGGLAVAGAGALSGCSTDGAATGSSGASSSSAKSVKQVGFDYPFTSLPVYAKVASFAKDRAKQKGVSLVLDDDQMTLDKQVANLTAWQGQKLPAIVSFPLETTTVETIAKAYIAAGGIWVTYGGDLENQSGSIAFSFYEAGKLLAEHAAAWAKTALGGQGKAAFLTDNLVQLGRLRTQGIVENFAKNAPGIEVVAQAEAIDPQGGLKQASAILGQHPDVNIFLAVTDSAGLGAYQALTEAGRSTTDPKTYVGGMDGDATAFSYIKSGGIYRGSAAESLKDIGNAVIDVPLAVAHGTGKTKVNLPITMLDAKSPHLAAFMKEFG